jgi:hypothetical protein
MGTERLRQFVVAGIPQVPASLLVTHIHAANALAHGCQFRRHHGTTPNVKEGIHVKEGIRALALQRPPQDFRTIQNHFSCFLVPVK